MKLLIISPKFHPIIGGGETYVLNSAKRMQQQGAEVHVAVEPNSQRELGAYPFDVHEIEGLSDGSLDVIKATANLYKLVEKIQPDVIHVHGYFALLIVGFVNVWNIPVIVSVHSTPVWGERIVGGMNSFKAEFSFAQHVLSMANPQLLTAANEVYAETAVKVADGKVPVAVLPYPVDSRFFSSGDGLKIRQTFRVGPLDKLILVPSRIIERKGIREAVHALGELPDNFYLCLPAAVEPLDAEYWARICSEPIYAAVKHRIIVPKSKILYEEMPNLYAAADIVAMPSYYEGAPVATVEAMASGKPFVGADSQGINSFIHNDINGLLVPQKDSAKLAVAILRLSRDEAACRRYAVQSRQDVEALSWDNQINGLLSAYEKVISRQGSMRSKARELVA